MKQSALTRALATAVLAGMAHAQSQDPAHGVHAVQGPIQAYRLHYATGKLEKVQVQTGSQQGNHAVSTTSYQNDCLTGFFTNAGTSELVDWGDKSAGLTTIVDSFSFGYGTTSADASLGGPGASIDIAFYEGTSGFGTLGTEVARFSFTGLPGSTTGAGTGFTVDVDLSGGFEFCLADGDIGYGYCSPSIASTGPLIVNINTCMNGQDDAYDVFTCPAGTGTYGGSFFFGGSPTASWYMNINEDDGSEVATTVLNNGAGGNPVVLDDGGVPPRIGQIYPATINTGAAGQTASFMLIYDGSLPPGTLILSFGEVIVNPTSGLQFSSQVIGSGLNDHSVLVPKDVTLIGFDFTIQGVMLGGPGLALTNARDVHLGF